MLRSSVLLSTEAAALSVSATTPAAVALSTPLVSVVPQNTYATRGIKAEGVWMTLKRLFLFDPDALGADFKANTYRFPVHQGDPIFPPSEASAIHSNRYYDRAPRRAHWDQTPFLPLPVEETRMLTGGGAKLPAAPITAEEILNTESRIEGRSAVAVMAGIRTPLSEEGQKSLANKIAKDISDNAAALEKATQQMQALGLPVEDPPQVWIDTGKNREQWAWEYFEWYVQYHLQNGLDIPPFRDVFVKLLPSVEGPAIQPSDAATMTPANAISPAATISASAVSAAAASQKSRKPTKKLQ